MNEWFIRDRGRVIGPFSTEQILDMRDRGQVQGYHEVSPDRRAWKAVDLVPELVGGKPPGRHPVPVARPVGAPPARPAPRDDDPVVDRSRRSYSVVVGGLVALVLLGGLALGGILLVRQRGGDNAGGRGGTTTSSATSTTVSGGADATPRPDTGVISFSSSTQRRERDTVLREAVCLVVPGLAVTYADGRTQEVGLCSIDRRKGSAVIAFGYQVLLGEDTPTRRVHDFGTGSGFTINPDGHVITNRHVVENLVKYKNSIDIDEMKQFVKSIEPKIWLFFSKEAKVTATVVRISESYDMAVLKMDRPARHYFALCQTVPRELPILDGLLVAGFPGKDRRQFTKEELLDRIRMREGGIQHSLQEDAFEMSERVGRMNKRSYVERRKGSSAEVSVVQHDASIFHGNSGGPLIARDGTVIGINTFGRTDVLKLGKGSEIELNEGQFNFSLTMPQMKVDLDAVPVPNVNWRLHPD